MSNTDTVDIFELRYAKVDLAAAPEAERQFYLMVTGLANDIQILLRQYLIAIKQDDDDKAKQDASSAVAMLNLRLLAGRFHEGWLLVEERWPALSPIYADLLSVRGADARAGLQKHFAVEKSKNIVFMIRNKIGFHSDYKFTKVMFDETPDDTQMVEYVGQAVGDTLFLGSEITHYAAPRRLTGITDDLGAFGAVMDELRTLQNLFLVFANAYVAAFATRNLRSQYSVMMANKRRLEDLPLFDTMRIPFFADFSSSLAAKTGGAG